MRFLTYSHDSYGLGHLKRTFIISRHLADSAPDDDVISLIGSSFGQSYFNHNGKNHDYIKLPGILKVNRDQYTSRNLNFKFDELIELRSLIIAKTLESFKPDVFIVDKVPRGVGDELTTPIQSYRKQNPKGQIILSLRDILDNPEIEKEKWKDPDLVNWLNQYYNEIWIWGEEDIYNTVEQYSFPEVLKRISRFMGYFPPDPPVSDYQKLRTKAGITDSNQKLLLISAGGGCDALPIFLEVVSGIIAANHPETRIMLVSGPCMNDTDYERIRIATRPIKDQIRLVRFLNNFDDWLRASDAGICMGGYNTMRESAAIGKPILVAPRTYPRLEQYERAQLFTKYGWCQVVDNDQNLAEATENFCHLLHDSKLFNSLTTLPCRGLDSLHERIKEFKKHPKVRAGNNMNHADREVG